MEQDNLNLCTEQKNSKTSVSMTLINSRELTKD